MPEDFSRLSAVELIEKLHELLLLIPGRVHFVGGDDHEIESTVALLRAECKKAEKAGFSVIFSLTGLLFNFKNEMHLWPKGVTVQGPQQTRFRSQSTLIWNRMAELVRMKTFHA